MHSNNKININNKIVGEKPYFIADIASNHDGELKRAFKLIELAKEAGADAAKFQNFKANTIVSKSGFNSLRGQLSHQASWKKSVYEVYEDASIDDDWTAKLKSKCDEVGIEYMTSPYDFQSVDLVDSYVNAYKIGSGDITWTEILKYIAAKGKPVIISTGASTIEDVQRSIDVIEPINKDIILLQCNTNYTASKDNYKYINLNVLKEYKKRYPNIILGLSDHTKGHSTVLGAIALGASVIEKHFTDDNDRVGPDHKFSTNPKEWRRMVDSVDELYQALGDGIKRIEENERDTAIVQRRALYFTRNLHAGHVLSKDDLFPLRPIKGDAIPPYEIENLVGRKLNMDVEKDSYIRWEHVEK